MLLGRTEYRLGRTECFGRTEAGQNAVWATQDGVWAAQNAVWAGRRAVWAAQNAVLAAQNAVLATQNAVWAAQNASGLRSFSLILELFFEAFGGILKIKIPSNIE